MPHENDDRDDDFLNLLNKLLEENPKITIVYEHSHGSGGGVSSSGVGSLGRVGIGDLVSGGGVVTDVTESSITINFPGGTPNGPINLPGVDTTVIVEHSKGRAEEGPSASPFGIESEIVASFVGFETEGIQTGQEVGGVRTRYELPHPGSVAHSVRIHPRVLDVPRNDSTCSCAVFIASWNAAGNRLDTVMLLPGESIPEYHPPSGAVVTRFACSAGCAGDCTCAISVKSAAVS